MTDQLAEAAADVMDEAAVAGGNDAPAPAPAPEPVSEEEAMSEVYRRIMKQNGAERGPDGKFKSTRADVAAALDAPEDGQQDAPDQSQEAAADGEGGQEAEAPPPASQIPQSLAYLPQGMKDAYLKLDEGGRKELETFVSEQQRKFGELGKQYGIVKPIHDQLAAASQTLPHLRGMPPQQIIQEALTLATWVKHFKNDPVGVLLHTAQKQGVMEHLKARLNGTEVPPDDHHQVHQLLQLVPTYVAAALEQKLEQKETESLVDRLSKDKPHFAEVEAELPDFIQLAWRRLGEGASRDAVFDLAYDMAVNARPDLREKVRKAEAEKATAATADPKRTEAARRAASINVRSTGNGKERPMTEEEAMKATYRRLMQN